MKVTAQQVEEAVNKSGITKLDHHDCSMCGYMCAYLFRDGLVGFDAGCNCVTYHDIRQASYQEIADWINMQNEEWSTKIWTDLTKERTISCLTT